jgi:hypothetical protein
MSEAAVAEKELSEDDLNELFDQGEEGLSEAAEETLEDVAEDEAPAEEPAEDAAPTQAQQDWEKEYRTAQQTIAQLQQNVRSNSGRVSAYQQKINQLELQLKQSRTGAANSTTAESNAIPQQDAQKVARQVVDLLMSGDEEKAATALATALSRGAVNGSGVDDTKVRNIVNEAIRPFQAAEQTRYKQSQEQALESIHPNWRETARSSEFRHWVEQQPASVQMLVKSDDAADAATLLTYYKQARGLAQAQPAPAPNERVAQIQAKRERQLSQGQSPSTRGGGRGIGGSSPDDPDALFEYLERHDPDYGRR